MVQFPDAASCSSDPKEMGTDATPAGALLSSVIYTTSCASILESHLPNTVTTVPSSSQHDNPTDPSATTSSMAKTDYDVCKRTCQWKKADGKPWSLLFPLEHFVDMHRQASAMTHQELDLVLMGSLLTSLHDHDTTVAWGRH